MQNSLKYLFLDSGILNGHWCDNTELRVMPIKKDEENNPLFREEYFADSPKLWEVRYDNGYPNVFYDEEAKLYRLYYTLFIYDEDSQNTPLEKRPEKLYDPTDSRVTAVCYAESKDGVHWIKPDLGIVEFQGNKHNNIIMRNAHGTSVFYDREEINPEKRYKLLTKIEFSVENHFMAVAFSGDGIHFCDPIPWPRFNPQADTYNFVFRDSKTNHYVLITRIWKNGLRIVAKCESEDFLLWSEPVEIARGEGFAEQIYTMPVFETNGLYLGLASMYHEGDRSAPDFDMVDLRLTYSADLNYFELVGPRQNFIPRGEGIYPEGEFDCGCIYSSIPVEIEERLYFYYMGGNGQHTNFRETSFARGYIEKDCFACYQAINQDEEAILTTASFSVYGDELEILSEIDDGYIICEVVNKRGGNAGGLLEGVSSTITESGWQKIRFEGHSLTELKEQSVAFRFTFKNAKLFGLKGAIRVLPKRY